MQIRKPETYTDDLFKTLALIITNNSATEKLEINNNELQSIIENTANTKENSTQTPSTNSNIVITDDLIKNIDPQSLLELDPENIIKARNKYDSIIDDNLKLQKVYNEISKQWSKMPRPSDGNDFSYLPAIFLFPNSLLRTLPAWLVRFLSLGINSTLAKYYLNSTAVYTKPLYLLLICLLYPLILTFNLLRRFFIPSKPFNFNKETAVTLGLGSALLLLLSVTGVGILFAVIGLFTLKAISLYALSKNGKKNTDAQKKSMFMVFNIAFVASLVGIVLLFNPSFIATLVVNIVIAVGLLITATYHQIKANKITKLQSSKLQSEINILKLELVNLKINQHISEAEYRVFLDKLDHASKNKSYAEDVIKAGVNFVDDITIKNLQTTESIPNSPNLNEADTNKGEESLLNSGLSPILPNEPITPIYSPTFFGSHTSIKPENKIQPNKEQTNPTGKETPIQSQGI